MAASVNPSIVGKIGGAQYIYDMFYLWGFSSAFLVYITLSHFFPAEETLIPATIHEDIEVMNGVEYLNDGVSTPIEVSTGSDGDEKRVVKSANYTV
jgi:NCS1 family nucleobase:cation symporter-1